MKKIEFSKEETALIVRRIQVYFDSELDQEIGTLPAQMLLDFFTDEIGSYHYNRGLYDAQEVITRKVDDISDAIYGLEKRTEFDK